MNGRFTSGVEIQNQDNLMKKIKQFKVNFRLRGVLRNIKNTSEIKSVTPEIEEAAKCQMESLSSVICPALVYETFEKTKLPECFSKYITEKWIALSLYTITLGKQAEQEINSALKNEEKILYQIMHAIALEGLSQSANFAWRLINEEAKSEKCEISKRIVVDLFDDRRELTGILDTDKVGVSVSESGFSPSYSSCGIIYWKPIKKKKV